MAEKSLAIAEVFETPAPYSTRTLDSVGLADFFTVHPEYRRDSAAIAAFYQRRDMRYAWIVSDSLSGSADAFVAMVAAADTTVPGTGAMMREVLAIFEEGFSQGRRVVLCDSCARAIELRLTGQFFVMADRKYSGLLDRDLRELDWFIPRKRKDPSRMLDSLAMGTTDLSAYEPIHPQYALLKDRLRRYHELAAEPWPSIALAEGLKKLVPGDTGSTVVAIRERLSLLGDLAENDGSARYDSTLLIAVQQFQARHGLHPDGVIGAGFIKAINVPVAVRLRTMLVNMERLRWVDERNPSDLILVNIPEFRMHLYDADTLTWSMNVVVGRSATRTVIFSDSLDRIVFSPTWTVPPGIMGSEILPGLKKNTNYLAGKNMELLSNGKVIDPGTVDWSRYSRGIPYTVRQKPGPSNALGLVKFLFPNEYHIYFHDTPSKGFFAREQRAFSHGCIRVSEPKRLAEYLLQADTTWTADAIDKAMKSGKERMVMLPRKRPVVIAYFTAWVDREGRLNFREDVYGHDDRLAGELFAPIDAMARR